MKKSIFRFGIIALLFVLLFSFSSCDKEDTKIEDDLEYVIQDETTWNEAFEKLDFVNFSMKMEYPGVRNDKKIMTELIHYVTESCMYGISKNLDVDNQITFVGEGYIIKTEKTQ